MWLIFSQPFVGTLRSSHSDLIWIMARWTARVNRTSQMLGIPMTPFTDSPIRAPLRVQHIVFRGRGSESRDFFTLESRRRVGSRIRPHCSEELLGEGFQVDAMGVACIGHSMEDPDRTADAKHPVADHNPDGRRPSSHDFVDRHLGIDGFRSVHGTRLQRRRSKPSAAPRTLRGRKQRAKGGPASYPPATTVRLPCGG